MPQDNASVIVKRDTKSVIDQTPKVNGQMLWTTDIGQDNHIYTDVIDPSDNTVKRIQIGGITPETKQVIQQAVTDASASASSASTSATNASNSATEAKSYAKGGTGSRQGEDTDNAKYYKEQADTSATNASTSATNASNSATTATNKATEASTSATNASNSATQASEKATLSESYAKGGTGTRQGEDTDNAEYYKEQAKAYAESASQGVQPATPTKIGGVKPDGTTITVDADGTIHGVGGSNVSVDGTTIVKNSNDVISVNEYVGTKAQAEANLSSIPDGATVYTTDESGELSVIDTELNASSNHAIANSTVTTALSSKVNKSDITNISITGTTNNTGSNILAGTLFYLNGTLCKTLVDVANGATFTDGTNYTQTTLNGLAGFSNYKNLYSDGNGGVTIYYNDPNGVKALLVRLNDTLGDSLPDTIQITDPKLYPHSRYHFTASNYYDLKAQTSVVLDGSKLTFLSKDNFLHGGLLYF